ncbi:MAG: hypothetical protein M1825_004599 [Sarcosagium campestre]|nr:MAG: hypothetical protein M1825_004599 [Sarcosagium campestre]
MSPSQRSMMVSSDAEPKQESPELESSVQATPVTSNDMEVDAPIKPTVASDPLNLSAGIKSVEQIQFLRQRKTRKRDCFPASIIGQEARESKKLQKFYKGQNEKIERLLKPVEELCQEAEDDLSDNQFKLNIAIKGSFLANLILAGLQIYAATSSGSLSLFTTMADAIFDPMSNLMLILSNRAVKRVDHFKYPAGKAKFETAGNIVFCFLMCSVSFVLIAMSSRDLIEGSDEDTKGFHLPSMIAVAVAFATKLALLAYCWALRGVSSQIHILWVDHRNDLFLNAFGLATSVGGSRLKWWIDPMGAIILACLTSTLWVRTAYGELQLLVGVAADKQLEQHLTYIAMTHSPRVMAINAVRAYQGGPRAIVEIDIVMDREETLSATQAVADSLRRKLESHPDVERAHVRVGYDPR